MPGPLSNIRVLDLSRIMAGPWAGQILADLGADVIKVERKGFGDDTRRWGPPYLNDKDGKPTEESGYYLSVNRGKRSVELDLASPEGQKAVQELAMRSDIVLENFKVGTLDRYGLGQKQLRAINPRLIYCSITGFGQDGPMAEDAAYDFMIQGMGGLMSVTGAPDGEAGGGPQKVGIPIVDIMTGMYCAISVLAALSERNVSGKGDYIDLAMLDVATAMLANQAMNYLISGNAPERRGNRHPNIQPQDVFAVKDGHMVLAVGNDEQFARLADALERPELAEDPRYRKNADRVRNLDTLHPILTDRLKSRDLADWLARLGERKIPCGPINTVPMVFEEAQVKHRQMLRNLPHPLSGELAQVVSPMRFERSALSFDQAPPLLGADTEAVLQGLGLQEEIN
jgi:crotonobetainyl-CoA:carnitine CoA-transferase CaiB-like acyl-CoA transferase